VVSNQKRKQLSNVERGNGPRLLSAAMQYAEEARMEEDHRATTKLRIASLTKLLKTQTLMLNRRVNCTKK